MREGSTRLLIGVLISAVFVSVLKTPRGLRRLARDLGSSRALSSSAAGPAVIEAFLATRREAEAGTLNPLYVLDAASFSDAFLALALALLISLMAALGLKSTTAKETT